MLQWKQQINLIFFVHLIIISCLEMSNPYWPLIIHSLNHSMPVHHIQYWSAAIFIIPFLITIITTPLWTRLGDKVGHKKMLIRACCALAITQILIGFVTHPLLILIIRLFQGLFAGYTAAAQAWAVTISRPELHSYVIGRMQSAAAIGAILGPLLGGFIANYFGYTALFYFAACVCSIVLLPIIVCFKESTPIHVCKKLAKAMSFSDLQKCIQCILITICCTQAARWMSASYFALYVVDRLHGGNLTVGLLYGSIALAIFITSPQWGKLIDKNSNHPYLIRGIFGATLLLAGCSQYLFAFTSNHYIALISSLLWGISLAAISLIPFSMLMKAAQGNNYGTLIGLGNSANKLGNLAGIAAGALIQVFFDYTISFIIIGVVYCALGSILLFAWNTEGSRGPSTLRAPHYARKLANGLDF